MSGAIDLSQLPPPTILETLDFEATLEQRRQEFIALFPPDQQDAVRRALLLPSDSGGKLLEFSAFLETMIRQRINEAVMANMLAFAEGPDLDHLAANMLTYRKTIVPADTTVTPPVAAVMESDRSLRLRAQQSPESLSTAGPGEAYEAFARNADGQVADARAISPSPACVTLTVLSTEGDGSASPALLEKVRLAVTPKNRRPIADRVTVISAKIIHYKIRATLIVLDGPQSELIRTAASHQARRYADERRRIGRQIRREKVVGVLNCDGVDDIILHEPENISVSDLQSAYCTDIVIEVRAPDHATGGRSE